MKDAGIPLSSWHFKLILTPMKNFYLRLFIIPLFSIMLMMSYKAFSQCPNGVTPTGTAFDTTITVGSGHSTREIKFPKFDPLLGMVTCVKLTMTITGIINYIEFENNDVSPNIFNATYNRHDTLMGPGLSSPMKLATLQNYGPYILDASDGVPHNGPDYTTYGPDTVLHGVALTATIADSAALSSFYGHDSVSYFYTIDAFTSPGAPGNYSFSVFTSGFVNYKLEYCICPFTPLPLNVWNLAIKKIADNKAELKWDGLDDAERNYHYEVEVSEDGSHFFSISTIAKESSVNNNYRFVYDNMKSGLSSYYYFRIKQVYSNGYTRFSDVVSVELKGSDVPKFMVYPNPSNGIVGIKFDYISNSRFIAQIFNTRGQTIMKKEILVTTSSYCQIGELQRGMYWLKLTDVTNNLSGVHQLLIK